MNSLEALEYLTSKVFTGGNSILETEANICKNIIKQDLERLETLESDLYKTSKIVTYLLNKNLALQQNEKLKKVIKDILKHITYHKDTSLVGDDSYYELYINEYNDVMQELLDLKEVLSDEMV